MKKNKVGHNHNRPHGSKNTGQLSKQEVTKDPSLGGEKNDDYVCSECRLEQCRSSKIDNHLVTLRKFTEKAFRYTKKREKELTDVMKRLQEEKENMDQLSYKMNMRRNQLRQDHLDLQHEERGMAEKLEALKEKEIFLNCQMVKLQSQEQAIKHRRRGLNKEKLRIEKLAYLIFKTDLTAMTYKEFHDRIGKMQNQLERKYRKVKLFEHYCVQHKTPHKGIQLEPIIPIEQTFDPAVAAFKEEILGQLYECDLIDSSNTSLNFFVGDNKKYLQNKENEGERHKRKVAKEKLKKTNFKPKTLALANDNRLSFSLSLSCDHPSQPNKFTTTTVYETKSNLTGPISESNTGLSLEVEDASQSRKGVDDIGSKLSTQVMSSLAITKKSKSEQENLIVKDVTNNVQRLVMSAKETVASAHRLLQTPLPCVDDAQNDENQNPKAEASRSLQSQPDEDYIAEENEECDQFLYQQSSDVNEVDSASDSFLSDIPEDEVLQFTNSDVDENYEEPAEILNEAQVIHRRISRHGYTDYYNEPPSAKASDELTESECSKNSRTIINWSTVSKEDIDENGICSIFRNSRNDEDKVSSQSLIYPHLSTKCIIPFKCQWKKQREKTEVSESDLFPSSADETDNHDQFDDLVKDRLSQFSESTQNEIVYAIGKKTLAQMTIDKVSKSGFENQPSKHGDQVLHATSNKGIALNDDNNNLDQNQNLIICPAEHRTGSGRPRNPYLQMIRRGVQTPVRKGPRKIPSHLKFGHFNIGHRNRRRNNNNSYRLQQSSTQQQQQQGPSLTFHRTDCSQDQPSSSLLMENNSHQQSATKFNKSNADSSLKNDHSSCNEQISNNVSHDFNDSSNNSYNVGIVVEKILGIPSRRNDHNNSVVRKLSHSRAFRV